MTELQALTDAEKQQRLEAKREQLSSLRVRELHQRALSFGLTAPGDGKDELLDKLCEREKEILDRPPFDANDRILSDYRFWLVGMCSLL